MSRTRNALMLAAVLAACNNTPREGSRPADTPTPAPGADVPPPLSAAPGASADSAPVTGEVGARGVGGLTRPPSHPAAPSTSDTSPIPASPRSSTIPVTVRELVSSDRYVGRVVRVTGTCLGYGTVAVGGPPVTRSDWQLGDEGIAIYVTGERPADCDATRGSRSAVTLTAHVAQDTLPGLPGRAGVPRRYLERIRQ